MTNIFEIRKAVKVCGCCVKKPCTMLVIIHLGFIVRRQIADVI